MGEPMPVAVVFLLISGSALVAWVYPQYRVPALSIAGLFLALVLVYLTTTDFDRPTAADRIALDQVELSELTLSEERLAIRLDGRVKNLAEGFMLREMALTLRLFDCPTAESPLEACETIAEDDAPARVAVPPGQLRGFEAVFGFPNRPPLAGTLVWRHEVTGTDATVYRN